MASHADQSLWEHEQAFVKEQKKNDPAAFVPSMHAGNAVNERVGIFMPQTDRVPGYIRYSPLDFIVEEIKKDGTVVRVDAPDAPSPLEGTGTAYADVVKVGISTLDAAQRIADALGTDAGIVGYAGIKDAVALTAQRISVRGAKEDALRGLSVPNVLLRNIAEGKGVIAVGDLAGNRFTLFIRTDGRADETALQERVARMAKEGIMNYYGPQRFGSPRYLSHVFGLHLMRGDYEGAVRAVLCEESPFEWPYVAAIRRKMSAAWGDWHALYALTESLPHTFRHERTMLKAMDGLRGKDAFVRALEAVEKQTDMWARAYASRLTNELLSMAEKTGARLPETLPLLLSQNEADRAAYAPFLKRDGTEGFTRALLPFRRFVNIGRRPSIPAKLYPTFHGLAVHEAGVALSFDLPKAAYATTVLMHLFDLGGAGPGIPAWLKPEEVDTKALLGTGSLTDVRAHFRNVIDVILNNRQEASEE